MQIKKQDIKGLSILLITLWTLSGCNKQRSSEESPKPNMVFILTDDQAWNVLGKDGHYDFMRTPNLDQLSREGLAFENAFVTTSLCSPSRACFMTGTYAHANGVYINGNTDPDPEAPFLPKILQEAGYETAFVGKWHMKPGAEPRQGFDYWLSFDGQGEYIDPPLNENGRDFIEKGYMTDILTNYAIRWLDEPKEKPFCLFLWHKAVHAPFTPAPRDSAAFPNAHIPEYESWYDDMEDKPEWLRRNWVYGVHYDNWKNSQGKPVPDKIDPRPWDPQNEKWRNYLRAMLAVDKSTGVIRDHLEKLGILDNTIVVFGSDNGYFLGAHQRGDKRLMYEESIRIPLIIRYPQLIDSGKKNNEMVLNIDIAPTLIELAGGNIPDEMHGKSLVPLFNEEAVEWRQSIFYEYFQEPYAPGFVTVTGVRNERYKYIETPNLEDDINELYDLAEDPGEMNNLINDPAYESVKSQMISELALLKKETGYVNPKVFNE